MRSYLHWIFLDTDFMSDLFLFLLFLTSCSLHFIPKKTLFFFLFFKDQIEFIPCGKIETLMWTCAFTEFFRLKFILCRLSWQWFGVSCAHIYSTHHGIHGIHPDILSRNWTKKKTSRKYTHISENWCVNKLTVCLIGRM